MRSCREISALVSRGLDKPLNWRERLEIRLHVAMCSSCRNFQRQTQFIRKAARRFGTDLEHRFGKKS